MLDEMMVTDCTVAPHEQRVGYDRRGKKPSEGQQGRRIKQLRMMKGKFFTTQRHILLIDRERRHPTVIASYVIVVMGASVAASL